MSACTKWLKNLVTAQNSMHSDVCHVSINNPVSSSKYYYATMIMMVFSVVVLKTMLGDWICLSLRDYIMSQVTHLNTVQHSTPVTSAMNEVTTEVFYAH